MKKINWYRGLSLADDRYIAEAHPDNIIKTRRGSKILVSLAAACACFALLLGNLWLFVPFSTTPPDVSRYSDSEYYGIIQKLNTLTFEQPAYKNNAEKLWAGVNSVVWDGLAKNESADGMYGGNAVEEGASDNYQEITDNQVQGVTEADKIKRSDKYIYYLDDNVLRIFSIDKLNTKMVGKYSFSDKSLFLDQWELYLSSDCKTVTVVTQCYEGSGSLLNRYVKLISLDVSDPANIIKKDEFSITGSYISSRMTNGGILLLTEFVIDKQRLDFSDHTTFLPQINDGSGPRSIPADAIVSPEDLNNTRYTVVIKLDENTLDLKGTAAYLSYSEDVYVSESHLFLTHVFADRQVNEHGMILRNSMTRISCLSYEGDGFDNKGSITVRGYVKDQWSMDEYKGILRVVTTTNATVIQDHNQDYSSVSPNILQTATGQSNASLYCVDLSSLEVVASVEDFAPPREEVQSVRFDKENAYVCTSIELSDPVFFFDLSDLNNITFKDTGTIEGFSTSLINLGNGYLLGIGRGTSWSSFKIEVYEEAEDGVVSVCSYEIQSAEYSTEYKSYYIDRENQLIGIGITDYTNSSKDGSRYLLLHFDGYGLVELVNVSLNGTPASKRGAYIDGYMYMFGALDFKVAEIFG